MGRMRHGVIVALTVTCAAAALTSCGKSSTSTTSPSTGTVTTTEAATIGSGIGRVTLAALAAGGGSVGVTSTPFGSTTAFHLDAAAGATFGSAVCPAGGRVDLVYVRTYTPTNGDVDLTALRETLVACALSTDTPALSGDLTMSGHYFGTKQLPSISLTGSLTIPGGTCSLTGIVDAAGGFSGSACGSAVTPTAASLNLAGTWAGTMSDCCGTGSAAWTATESGSVVTGPLVFTGGNVALTYTLSGVIGSNGQVAWSLVLISTSCSASGAGSGTASTTSLAASIAMGFSGSCSAVSDRSTQTYLLSLARR